MSNDSKQKDAQQSDDTSKNDKKSLTYKDWKLLKESQSKTNEKSGNTTNKAKNKNYNRNNYNNNDSNEPRSFNSQGASNFFPGNSIMANNFNGINNFNNNGMQNFNNKFGMRANYNNFGSSNNGFNQPNNYGFNNFNAFNNNNRSNNFDGNNFNNFNGPNPFGNDRNRFNGNSNGNNIDLPDNFFASDGIYRQKDLMQKPLPDNPFRHEKKADQLIQEFNNSRYTKNDKKKKKLVNKKSTLTSKNKTSEDKLHNREPAIYISNPKAKIDGKPYIPKPKIPEENLDISKEEKKQQWKEYREAMKPFKNREFYNAKRVVQRLGKLDPSELDEKQIIRLANAREVMFKHKTFLTEKYANYEKTDDPSDLGEVYVLKDKSPKNMVFRKPQNYGNFGENDDFESGRKILGGYTAFVPGGILKGSGII